MSCLSLDDTCNKYMFVYVCHVKWVHVTTAWHVLGFWMGEEATAMEDSCEYIK
jgi:hypothetical protein